MFLGVEHFTHLIQVIIVRGTSTSTSTDTVQYKYSSYPQR